MKRLIRFSSIPHKKKLEQLRILEENRIAFQQEMRERNRWKKENDFNETPYLDKWESKKSVVQKELEDLTISAIGFVDASSSATNSLAIGLGLKGTLIDADMVEDLVSNIYFVRLAEMICSKHGANLNKETRDLVIKSLVEQTFPPSAPYKPAKTPEKGERILEELYAIKNQNR